LLKNTVSENHEISTVINTVIEPNYFLQIASVPDQAKPNQGELVCGHIFEVLKDLGYDSPLGAEYKSRSSTEAGLVRSN